MKRDILAGVPPLFPRMSSAVQSVLCYDFAAPFAGALLPWSEQDIDLLLSSGLAPVALRLISDYGVSLSNQDKARLKERSVRQAVVTMVVATSSIPALRLLIENKISFRVFKGPTVARASFARNERPFQDIDILVSPRQFMEAKVLLENDGYRENQSSAPPRFWFDRFCREAVNLRHPAGGSLDLHHHIPPWLWAQSMTLEALSESESNLQLSGISLPAANTEYNLLIACLHLVSDHNRPGHKIAIWRDILNLARLANATVVLDLARQHGLIGWLRWIIEQIPAPIRPSHLWSQLAPRGESPLHSYRLKLLLPPNLTSRPSLSQAARLPIPNAVAYAFGMVLPSRDFLHKHLPDESTYLAWWRTTALTLLRSARHK